MLNKSRIFNYLTLIIAICSVCITIYSIIMNYNRIYSVILIFIALLFNYISKKINDKENMLTDKEKDFLSKFIDKSEEN